MCFVRLGLVYWVVSCFSPLPSVPCYRKRVPVCSLLLPHFIILLSMFRRLSPTCWSGMFACIVVCGPHFLHVSNFFPLLCFRLFWCLCRLNLWEISCVSVFSVLSRSIFSLDEESRLSSCPPTLERHNNNLRETLQRMVAAFVNLDTYLQLVAAQSEYWRWLRFCSSYSSAVFANVHFSSSLFLFKFQVCRLLSYLHSWCIFKFLSSVWILSLRVATPSCAQPAANRAAIFSKMTAALVHLHGRIKGIASKEMCSFCLVSVITMSSNF